MRGTPVLLAATLVAAAPAGCATGGKEADVRAAAGRFLAAQRGPARRTAPSGPSSGVSCP